jgi:hypothetical protein
MSRPVVSTRFVVALCLALVLAPSFAFGAKPVNADKIAELEQRAEKAQPEEQCYLFAQLVSQMGEVADRQLADGDAERAAQTLARMEAYTSRIHQSLGPKNKRLKESEILVRETTRRVESMFHQAAIEQQDMLRGTLHKLNALQSELMMTVFQH